MIRRAFNEARENPSLVPLALLGAARGVHEVYIKPVVAENPAAAAWGLTLGIPLCYDTWAVITGHETMSHAYHRGVEHPLYKFMFIGALGVLALHLARGTGDAKAPTL